MADVKRIELPSGGWWEVTTEPNFGQYHDWLQDRDTSDSEARTHFIALKHFSVAWSFGDEISEATIRERSVTDVSVAGAEMMAVLAPFLDEHLQTMRSVYSSLSKDGSQSKDTAKSS